MNLAKTRHFERLSRNMTDEERQKLFAEMANWPDLDGNAAGYAAWNRLRGVVPREAPPYMPTNFPDGRIL